MVENGDFGALEAAVSRLRGAGVVPAIAARLEPDAARLAAALAGQVIATVPAYSESGNPDVLPELEAHLAAHIDEVLRLLGGGAPGDFGFVTEHARRRAEQKFPLDATHQAYRHVARMLSEWIRDAALQTADATAQVPRVVADVTDFTLEYMGNITTLLTSEYVEQTRSLAEAESDRRTELLTTLLNGYDESDRRAAQLLRRAGYLQQRQSYTVAVARSVKPEEMENTARAQRMVDAISDALAGSPVRFVAGIRDNLVFVIISGSRRLSGWTRPHSALAERVYPHLRLVGPAALIGLSNDVPSTSHIPRAAIEARFALDFADVANRVMRYSSIPFRDVLVTHARGEVQSALPAWVGDFTAADCKARGKLAATLRAYADADMNVLKTAKLLGVHANTVYARMNRIEEITGQDALGYHALTDMLLALQSAAAVPSGDML